MSFLIGIAVGAGVIAVAWAVKAKWLTKAESSIDAEADKIRSDL